MNNQFLCELCYPNGVEIGKVAEDHWLIFDDGKYFILDRGQLGHKDPHDYFVFPTKPTPDPDPNDEHEENDDPILDQWFEWSKQADCVGEWKMTIYWGYDLMDDCIKTGGWDREKTPMFDYWLYDKCGRMIQEWENNNDKGTVKVSDDGSSNGIEESQKPPQ